MTATGTGVFNTKDVNSANQVTLNTVLLADGANGGSASNYRLASGQSGAASIARRPSVTWTGTGAGNGDWSNPANWENGAIPDLANVANVVIPAGKSATFNANVATLNGAVQLDGISGLGGLTINSSVLKVANALNIGSYLQSAGEVDAGSLGVTSSFNQAGGKLVVANLADITQAGGISNLGTLTAANLVVRSGGGIRQAPGSALMVSDTTTLAAGGGDITLGNAGNDFIGAVGASGTNVVLTDKNVLLVSRIDAARADLSAGSALQVVPNGGIVNAADIVLALLPGATNGVIGSASNYFQVQRNALVTLGPATPAVSANFGALGGQSVHFVINNPVALTSYMQESADLFLNGIRVFTVMRPVAPAGNSPLAQILQDLQGRADGNAALIGRALLTDLSASGPYPHGGLVKARAPLCEVRRTSIQQDCPQRD